MRYALNAVHAEAIKHVMSNSGPITLLNLVRRLKEEKICSDLDNVMYICQLQKLMSEGKIDKNLIVRSPILSGLTNKQKIAIQNITQEASRNNESLSFLEIATRCHELTGEDSPEQIVTKIRFLLIPLTAESSNDDLDEEESGD